MKRHHKNIFTRKLKLTLLFFATLLFSSVSLYFVRLNLYKARAAGNTYYLSTTGNDSSPGSQSSPFRTFTKALSVLQPGDTLLINPGTYNQQLIVNKSGGSGSPITIKGATSQKPVINVNSQSALEVPDGISNVFISGLEITGASMQCALIRGTNITLDNIDSHHCRSFGYRITGKSVTIQNSQCRDNVIENQGGGNTSGGWGSCVKSGPGSANLVFRNNHIFNNWGEGLIIGQAAGAQAYDNLVHDNYSVNIYIGNSFDVDVYRNMTYSTNPTYYRGGNPSNCISASEELISGWGAQLRNVRVFNNIAYGCRIGMGYTYKEVSNNGCANCLFAYNTIVNSGGIRIIDGPKNSVTIRNNIISGPVIAPAGTIIDHNITGDPGFAGTPNTNPVSYRLRSNSAAINAAVAINGITTDFENKSRGSQSDIGAIEFTGSSGPTVTQSTNTRTPTPVRTLTPTRTPTSVGPTLTRTPTPTLGSQKPGDANGDGIVNSIDLWILVQNYGSTNVNGPSQGDFTGEGRVDSTDLAVLVTYYGS